MRSSVGALFSATEGLTPPDAVFMTGDLASSGQKAEYDSLAEVFMDPLVRRLEGEGLEPRIFMVPGNHDQDWGKSGNLNPRRIQALGTEASVDEFLSDEQTVSQYLQPFAAYQEFAARYAVYDHSNPLHWEYSLPLEGSSIAIRGVNSAWASSYFEDEVDGDERRLILGAGQVSGQRSGRLRDLSLVLLHHPTSWLNESLSRRAVNHLIRDYDVMASGHVHEASQLRVTTVAANSLCTVPSPLFCDAPYEDSRLYSRGFAMGQVDLDHRTVAIRYFRYSPESMAYVPNLDLYAPRTDKFVATLQFDQQIRSATSVPESDVTAEGFWSQVAKAPLSRRLLAQFSPSVPTPTGSNAAQTYVRVLDAIPDIATRLPEPPDSAGTQVAAVACYLALLAARRDRFAIRPAGTPDFSGAPSEVGDTIARLSETIAEFDSAIMNAELGDVAVPTRRFDEVELMGLFFWGIAKIIWTAQNPGSLTGLDAVRDDDRVNIIDVSRSGETGRFTLLLETRKRGEFLWLIEQRHRLELFFEEVEDLWRREQVVAPPLRFDFSFPRWSHKAVRHDFLTLDPKPITRLLMGKALYGDRKHVWLRELLQNALDAIEMRRITLREPDFRAMASVIYVDSRTVVISDNGVGMTPDYVTSYLTTLGRSGWRVSSDSGRQAKVGEFFGRFGIGFASVFSEAEAVTVKTRAANHRPADGITVRFTSPDRPFFMDPTVADAGTEIRIKLAGDLDVGDFEAAVRELFVYLRPEIHVEPAPSLPSRLEEVGRGAGSRQVVSKIERVILGQYPARLKMTLIEPGIPDKESNASERVSMVNDLSVSVSGVRVFSHRGLSLKKPERPYYGNEMRWINGCSVVVDFETNNAPVVPSRNDIDLGSQAAARFNEELERMVADGIKEIIAGIAREESRFRARRSRALRALSSMLEFSSNRYRNRTTTMQGGIRVTRAAAEAYLTHCPVNLRRPGESDRLVDFETAISNGAEFAVTMALAESNVFALYARHRQVKAWIVVADRSEGALLRMAPAEIAILEEAAQLFEDFEVLITSAEPMPLAAYLPHDYLLARSPLFDTSFFFHVPVRQTGPSGKGGRNRPRVIVNADHAIVGALNSVLIREDSEKSLAVEAWIASLVDGVIEIPKQKVRPRARWHQLRQTLSKITGVDVLIQTADELQAGSQF